MCLDMFYILKNKTSNNSLKKIALKKMMVLEVN